MHQIELRKDVLGKESSRTLTTANLTEQVWEALAKPLHTFLRRRVADEQTAEDLLQEVFLKIHTQIGSLREEEKLAPWVYQIARHVLIDFYRRQRPAEPLTAAETLADEQTDLEDEEMRASLAASVLAMLRCLPAPQQEALLLTDYQGLSQKELASRLGLSFSGAKSRVQRAREHLKRLYLACCHVAFDRLGRVIDYAPQCDCCQAQTETCENTQAAASCCVPLETAASSQEDAGACSCHETSERII